MSEPLLDEPRRPADGHEPRGIFDRTWELELLISVGVVFALLQLPPFLQQSFMRLEPRLTGWWQPASLIAYIYLKGIVYTLIVAFLLHLASRAYWVGLLGLEKVYPDGIRWDALKKSVPMTRRVQRELVPPLRVLIDRVDLFCSSIFPVAFYGVINFIVSIFLLGIGCAVAWGASNLPGGERVSEFFSLFFLVIALLIALPGFLDRVLGRRLDPESRMGRALARTLRGLYHLQLGPLSASISLVLLSHPRRRSATTVFVLALSGALVYLTVDSLLQRQSFWSTASPAAEREINSVHYEDQWPEEGIFRVAPSIQSDMIGDPYVKLFIPYLSRRHDASFAEYCPTPQTKLDCAARLHRVALDGRVVPDLTFHFYTHPKSGARGFLAYIPTAGLPQGPHLLRIEPLPVPKNRLRRKDPQPLFIRFWT